MTTIMRGKILIEHIRAGWELWHVGDSPLPGRWELRRRRAQIPVNWEAIEGVRRHYLVELDDLVEERQEGRFTWSYVPRQRALTGGVLL